MTYGRPGVYVNEALLPAPITTTGSAAAAGAVIGAFAQGPTTVTRVASWYDFVKLFGTYNASYPATFGVSQFFANSGGELYIKRVVGSGAANASATIPNNASGSLGTVYAKNVGSAGNNLRVRIYSLAGGTYNLSVYQEVSTTVTASDSTNDLLVESWDNLVFNSATDPNYVVSVINSLSNYITFINPSTGAISLTTGTPAVQDATHVLPLSSGADGSAVTATNFANAVLTDGTSEFDTLNRPLVIFAPELYAYFVAANAGNGSYLAANAVSDLTTVQNQLAAWAASGDGFAVLDTPPNYTPLQAIQYPTSASGNFTSGIVTSQAAVYYPNYYISDPLNSTRGVLRKVGPAAAVAGRYIYTDTAKGVFKAPAGSTTTLAGAVALERAFTTGDLDVLNNGISGATIGTSINAIRNLPGAGIVVMGARTLKQDGTANRYVNMRRSLIHIKKRMRDLTSFAVFQNNDYKLWSQVETVLTVFLNEYRNQGGLAGATPKQSFYVKVDAQNNPPASVATGVVNIEVGVALQYPSEFVVITLNQISGQ